MRKILYLTKSARYFFIILAIISSFTFIVIAQSTINISGVFDPTGPSKVILTTPEQFSGSSITLSWTPASNASIYTIETSANIQFNPILNSTSTNTLSATFNDLPEGVLLYYRVRPFNSSGKEGLTSNVVSSTSDVTAPQSSITSSLLQDDGSVKIIFNSYDAVSGINHVYLYYRINGGDWINNGDMISSPYIFNPPNQIGTYDFLSIATDKKGNIELKDMVSESSVYVSKRIIPTPTPTPTSTVFPSSNPTQTIPFSTTIIYSPTVTPIVKKNIKLNFNIYSLPFSTISIRQGNEEIVKKYTDTNGIISFPLEYIDNGDSLLLTIYDSFGTSIYTKFLQNDFQTNIVLPPRFSSYYQPIKKGDKVTINGTATPNSKVTLYIPNGNSIVTSETNADFSGSFSFTFNNYDDKNNSFTINATSTFENITSEKSASLLIVEYDKFIDIEKPKSQNPQSSFLSDITKKPIVDLIEVNSGTVSTAKTVLAASFIAANSILATSISSQVYNVSRMLFAGTGIGLMIKRKNKYGKVFDDDTKDGVPFAHLELVQTSTNKILQKTISNIQGYYHFALPPKPNEYYLNINQKNYIPKISNTELINNDAYIYNGGKFIAENSIKYWIPMEVKNINLRDSLSYLFNKLMQKLNNIFELIIKLLFFISIVYFVLTYSPNALKAVIFYGACIFLLNLKIRTKNIYGFLGYKYKNNTLAIENALINVYKNHVMEKETSITDSFGNLKLNLTKGIYTIEILKDKYEISHVSKGIEKISPNSILINTKKLKYVEIILKKKDE